jgi:transcriptional regulator PpsR
MLKNTPSDARNKLIQHLSPLVFSINDDGVLTDLSCYSADIVINRKSVIGKLWKALVTESDRQSLESALRMARHSQETQQLQVSMQLNPSDPAIPLKCVITQTEQDGLLIAAQDLRPETNLRQQLVNAQNALERDYWTTRQLEARYRRLLDMVSEGFLVIDDATGRVLEANAIAARLLNTQTDALIGKTFPTGLDEMAAAKLENMLRDARGMTGTISGSIKIDSDNTLSVSIACLRQSGESRFLVRLHGAAAAQPDQSQVFAGAPDPIVVTDSNGYVLAANERFLSLADIATEEQAIGRRIDRWIGRSSVDVNVLLSNVTAESALQLYSSTLASETGTRQDIEISACKLEEGRSERLVLFIRDVSRRLPSDHTIDSHLPRSIEQITSRVGRVPLKELVRESTDVIEALCIEAALKLTHDNRASAAELLGLSRQSLYTKLRRFDIGDGESVNDARA